MQHLKNSTFFQIVSVILIILVAISGCSSAAFTVEKPLNEITTPPLSITIAHVSDTHTYVMPYNFMLRIAGRDTLDIVGGYGLLLTAVEEIRGKEKNVLLLHAGDILEGTIWTPKFEGLADCDAMNAIRFDAMVPGNHEFSKSSQQAANIINRVKFPVLAANMDVSEEPLLAGKVKPYTIMEFEGQKVGIIGLTTMDTAFLGYPGKNILFLTPEDVARHYIAELNAQGINKIVILSHLGYDSDLKLAKSVGGIDIIVGGHSGTFMGGKEFEQLGLQPEMPYPTEVTGPAGDKVLIVHSWEYNRLLGVIKLDFDEKGKISSYSGQPFIYSTYQFMLEDSYGWSHLCPCRPEYGEIMQQIANNPGIKLYYYHPEIIKVLQPYLDQISSDMSTVVAVADENLYRGSNKGPGPLIADAFLWNACKVNPDVQLSLYDSYNIRSDIYKGNVTMNDIYMLLPLQQTLVTMTLRGSLLKMLLETAIDSHIKSNMLPPCFELSGFRITIDMSRKSGDRITSMQVMDKESNYGPMNMDAEYTGVITDYLADKGIAPIINRVRWMGPFADNVEGMLRSYMELTTLGIKDVDAMADYVRVQKNLKNITEQRTTVIQPAVK